jgi:branched-chain amino acid transport system substrate-binding protein
VVINSGELGMAEQPTAPITLGLTASLTGRFSIQGQQALAGVRAWIDDTNRAGGLYVPTRAHRQPVRLIVYDDASQGERCSALTERLIVTDQVELLCGPYSSGLTRRAAAVAEAHHQVMWNHGGSSDVIFTSGYRWVVGILTPASRYFHGVIDMLKSTQPSIQRVVIVHSSAGTFSWEVATGAEAYCQEQGFATIYRHAYPPGQVDFTPLLREMSQERPHLLLGVGHIEDDLRLAAQLVQNPLSVAAVALIATPMQLFQATLGDAAQGFLGPSQWEPGLCTVPDYGPSSEEVQQSFKRYAMASVDYPMAQAYAGCLVAQRCIEVAGSLEPECLRQVAGQLDFTTFYGRYTIDADTGCQRGHMMPVVQWHGGTKVIVWPPNPNVDARL